MNICYKNIRNFHTDLGVVLERSEEYEKELRKMRDALAAINSRQLCEDIHEARDIALECLRSLKLRDL